MHIVIAIDSFKGSLTSLQAGEAAARGIARVSPNATCDVRPLADGGEGTTDALVTGLGGTWRPITVTGPLGSPACARYGLLPNGTAVMEMAQAAGITLVPCDQRDPTRTTTYGVGEMILDALQAGAHKFIIGIGGSATNDGGAGMLQALGWHLLDQEGNELPRGGGALTRLARIVPPDTNAFASVEFRIACDVTNPLCGPQGASAVFGPQKGATPAMVAALDTALAHFATVSGGDAQAAGSGAAGGLGFAFKTFLHAQLVRGVDLILDETALEPRIRQADLVITGEGRLDGQTVMGKAPIGVAHMAKKHGKTVLAFSGCVGPDVHKVNEAGIDAFFPILRQITTLDQALAVNAAAENLTDTVEQALRLWHAARRP